MDVLHAAVTVVVLTVLLSASVQDWRHREIDDRHWWAISVFGSSVVGIHALSDGGYLSAVSVIASFILFSGMMKDSSVAIMLGAASSVVLWAFAYLSGVSDPGTVAVLAAPAFILLFYAAYAAGILPGGADVKCLMAVSMAAPAWGSYPPGRAVLGLAFPPSVAVMAVACIITVVSGVLWGIYKNRRLALSDVHCYRMPIGEARGAFVWPLEDVVDGRIVRTKTDDGSGPVYDRLEEHGAEDVLVSPMYPFVIPLTAAFVLVMLSS